MKDKLEGCDYLARFVERLNENDVSLIDFDELRQQLDRIIAQSGAAGKLAEAHALLRQDCQQRMAGMIKAIAAVDRQRDSYESALAIIEQLPSLSAEDLLRKYRQVSARFRDCFPTTFNGFQTGRHMNFKRSQLRDLK